MSFFITHNFIDEEKPVVPTSGQEDKMPFRFRLYDDDEILYFEGIISDSSSFDPLDEVGVGYGCTEERVFENGKWETL